jgi:hypothetical protein
MKTSTTLRTLRLVSGVALALALVSMSGDASAATGAALDATDLPAKTRTDLKAEIDKARIATPDLFRQVQDIAARAKELEAGARAPGIPLTMQFKPLGNRALFAMLELLVFDSHTKDLPPSAASALRLGLLEAVGAIRDARAIPVFEKVIDIGRDDLTLRASSEGLARIGTDDSLKILFAAATKAKTNDAGNDRERALLSGMHDGRRESVARFLAKRLQQNPDAETAKVVVKSLGGVGNAWAWKTFTDQTEASCTRGIAANALVDAFVRTSGDVREAAAKAIMVVDDASTPTLIAQAKSGASRDVAAALDDLSARFAKNPTR